MVDTDLAVPDGLALAGALLTAVGTYLPWIVPAPGADAVIQIYVRGMETGFSTPDYVVLAVLAAGLAAAAYDRPHRRAGYLAAVTGLLVVIVTVGYLALALTGGAATLGAFVPGVGAYLTVAGGFLLAAAGWRHVATTPPKRRVAGAG